MDAPDGLPSRIGPYKILDLLGEGGMGVVYLAEQTEPVRRHVALKLIKLGMDTRQVLARFEAERQALAILNHPNLAKVFDAGATEQGRPYFVMEYVPGLPITEYCDLRCLPLRKRLELFLEVCDAIQHAHQKGIIHRDVKPSNVLVSEDGGELQLKVIDFGVAKATSHKLTERTLFTQQGALIGTPGYMSPEQTATTALEVDTRSDIYSLGVLLYELLIGALPFDPRTLRRAAAAEMLRIIREEEPPRPSTRFSNLGDTAPDVARKRNTDARSLARQLRGELEWITMRALEKDPARRYQSANEFAADVGRHLRDESVLAGPPSATYRLRKFVRRHRLGASAAAVLGLGLSVGIVGSTLGLVQAKRAEARALREAKTSERVSQFLVDILGDVDPERAGSRLLGDLRKRVAERRRGRGGSAQEVATALASFDEVMLDVNATDAGLRLLDEEILARAAATVDERLEEEPEIAGRLYHAIGKTYTELDLFEAADRYLQRAVVLIEGSLGPEQADTLEARLDLVSIDLINQRFAEAEKRLRDIRKAARRSLGKEHPVTLRAARLLARALVHPTDAAEAEDLIRETLEIQRRVLGSDHEDTIASMIGLGNRYEATGKQEEAEELYREARETAFRALGEEHSLTLEATHATVRLLTNCGRYGEAEPLQLRNRQIAGRVLGDGHSKTIYATKLLGDIYYAQQRHADAETAWREALERYRDRPGGDMPDLTAAVTESLLKLYGTQGRIVDARALLASFAADCTERLERGQDLERVNRCVWFLQTLEPADMRDPQAALRIAFGLWEATDFEDPAPLGLLAAAYVRTGDPAAAIETMHGALASLSLDDALRVRLRQHVLEAMNGHAWRLLAVEPPDQRDPQLALKTALEICEASDYKNPYWLDTLALAYHLTGDAERAIESQRRALSLLPGEDTSSRAGMEQRLDEFEAAFFDGANGRSPADRANLDAGAAPRRPAAAGTRVP